MGNCQKNQKYAVLVDCKLIKGSRPVESYERSHFEMSLRKSDASRLLADLLHSINTSLL